MKGDGDLAPRQRHRGGAARFVLRKWGLMPEGDVAIIQIGEEAQRANAVRGGIVQTAILGDLGANKRVRRRCSMAIKRNLQAVRGEVMGRRVASLYIPFLVLFIALSESPGSAEVSRVRIAYSGIAGSFATLWVTKEGRFFERNGLDLEIVHIQSSSLMIQALIAGDVQFAESGAVPAINANLNGAGTVVIAAIINRMPFQLIVRPEIRSSEDLRGKTIGISRFGTGSDLAARYMLKHLNLETARDVRILQVGGQSERVAAMQGGSVQAAIIEPPIAGIAKKLGFRILVDMAKVDYPYVHMGLVTTRAYILRHEDVVRRVVRSLIEGIHFYKTNKAASLKVLGKYLKLEDLELLEEAHAHFAVRLNEQIPFVSVRGIRNILAELAAAQPLAVGADSRGFFDNTFVQEAVDSGLIEQLYGRRR